MYKLVYYYKKKENAEDLMKGFTHMDDSIPFRLRKNALHYLWEIVQDTYRSGGYSTEERKGSLYCYKSEKTDDGNRRIIEILIKVEKE